MFSEVHLQNFGAFSKFDWPNLGRVNVIVGENDTGKSHLLKVMYVIAKVAEGQRKARGEEDEWHNMLAEKLRWTFQPRRLSSLVRHEAPEAFIATTLCEKPFSFHILGGVRSRAGGELGGSGFDVAS